MARDEERPTVYDLAHTVYVRPHPRRGTRGVRRHARRVPDQQTLAEASRLLDMLRDVDTDRVWQRLEDTETEQLRQRHRDAERLWREHRDEARVE
jgi:hypothetical protein